MAESPGKGQAMELQAERIQVLGDCPEDYPLQKKEHSEEYLRELGHLRPRTQSFASVLRLRDLTGRAMEDYLHEEGFVQVHAPTIVSGDCEGAGELFTVVQEGEEKEPFFGQPAYLSVSAQLHAEAYAAGLSRVYSFGPTYRAERHSKTSHHLAEFWMLEPEFAFASLDQLMTLAEGTVCRGLEAARRSGETSLDESGAPFARLSYSEAIGVLEAAGGGRFRHPVSWGMDLQREHERYLCEEHMKGRPTFVYDYPAAIKPFYARQSDADERCVQAVDLLVPGIGEMIGGSVREPSADRLRQVMEQRGMHVDRYAWYLDLRTYGSSHTAGFGLGFDRFMQWITGVPNIRDVNPCPRWTGHIRM